MRRSEESSAEQLDLARAQGAALGAALEAMDRESDSGVHRQRVADYEVAVAIEEAEGLWSPGDAGLEWHDPDDANCHVEVCVRDGADGRFVPGLRIVVTLVGPDGDILGTYLHPFLWHPWLYHYGRNWTVPASGRHRVLVEIDVPSFSRHDHENGRRFADPVEIEFDDLEIAAGAKRVEA
jgi:hypothetical protein